MDNYSDGLASGLAIGQSNNNGGWGGAWGADWLWIIVLFALLGNNGWGFGGNNGCCNPCGGWGGNALGYELGKVATTNDIASGFNNSAVENLLTITAQECGCDKLNIHCYHNLIDGTLCYKRYNAHGATVGELSEQHKDKRLIIRINGHLTCSLYGTIVDIWDCTEKCADVYWIIE